MNTLKLSKNEMKKVLGGTNGGSTCSTTCKDGTSISVKCNGGCIAADEQYVACTDPDENKQQKCSNFKTSTISTPHS